MATILVPKSCIPKPPPIEKHPRPDCWGKGEEQAIDDLVAAAQAYANAFRERKTIKAGLAWATRQVIEDMTVALADAVVCEKPGISIKR